MSDSDCMKCPQVSSGRRCHACPVEGPHWLRARTPTGTLSARASCTVSTQTGLCTRAPTTLASSTQKERPGGEGPASWTRPPPPRAGRLSAARPLDEGFLPIVGKRKNTGVCASADLILKDTDLSSSSRGSPFAMVTTSPPRPQESGDVTIGHFLELCKGPETQRHSLT